MSYNEHCENCPLVTDFPLLEQRVAKLEESQSDEHQFRTKFYEDQRARIKHDAEIDMTLKSVNEKLDKLISWQSEQISKPIKRFDSIIDKILLVSVGGLTGYFVTSLLSLI